MRVAVCQLNAGREDVDANVATAVGLLAEAAAGGADLAALPELWPHYGSRRVAGEIAAPIPGPLTDPIAAVAREHGMWVLAGSVTERDDGRVYNTSPLFDREGELVATYRKVHLFDVQLDGQPPIRESDLFASGDQLVTHQTDLGRVGLSICYDLRFPELYRGLVAAGAELLAIPSAFTAVTGAAHWEVLVRARAIEDQCLVIAPAQWGPWGPPEDGRRTFGHSMVVDPWGEILVEAPGDGDGVWFAEVDRDRIREVRRSLPALAHRRLGTVC
ncbi:MAG TPA: carbon-nitrogen hydrolase family protein [Actinomycetota bacterium]|nr:carbon-nitrogen hydrolase family protein [Actinomycetota bacterium]